MAYAEKAKNPNKPELLGYKLSDGKSLWIDKDIAYYAAKAGLTPKYFASVIYEVSGTHPLDLVKEQVVLDAQHLLKEGKSIKEVCSILNFSSQSQFTSYFKTAVGIPPGEFIKSRDSLMK